MKHLIISILASVVVANSVFALNNNDSLSREAEGSSSERGGAKGMYAFGVAASFNDSIVYFTDVQVLDSVQPERKTGFLPGRSLYAYQLKNHIEYSLGKKNVTPMIYFGKNKAKLQKVAAKMIGKYRKQKNVVSLAETEFKFTKPVEGE